MGRDMLQTYQFREFIRVDGSLYFTPYTSYFSDRLESQGLWPMVLRRISIY